MAKFLCVCGQSLSTSGPIPNPDEWRCTSDADFTVAFESKARVGELYMKSTIMYRCPKSGHLWVFWAGIDELPALYAPAALPEGWN
jgi:hypothetical protein